MTKVTPRQIKCRSMLEVLGYSRSGASALTGNFCREVGPNLPTAFRTAGLDHGSNGLAQWRLGRLDAYKAYVQSQKPELVQAAAATGQKVDDAFWPWYGRLDFQTQFVAIELAKDYPALDHKLRMGGDVAALTADVCWQYERPSKLLSGIAERIDYAKAVAADTSEGVNPVTDIRANPTVVDQLHNTILAHDQKATGGFATAGIAGFGALGLLLSHVLHDVPLWEWVAVGVVLVVALLCLLGAVAERRNAANVASAVPGVTPVPPPAPVTITPASIAATKPIQMTRSGLGPLVQALQDDAFEERVKAEVERRLAMQNPPSAIPAFVEGGPLPPVSTTGPGAIMQVKKAGEV